jgi:hypothetical protein
MRMQQFDPSGAVLSEIRGGAGGTGYNNKVKNDLGMDIGGKGMGAGPETRMSRTAPSGSGSSGFLPQLTAVTAVNPHLKKASIVKDFVLDKRTTVRDELSVARRRAEHPVKKQQIWSCMVPKQKEYTSMSNRRKLLAQKAKKKI